MRRALAAIIFDFDGVIADCRSGTLLPNAESFVRAAAQSVPVAVASGAMTAEIDAVLTRFDLRDCFSAVVGIDQTLRTKPSPDPFLEALYRINAAGSQVHASRTVAFDDSVFGLIAARTAGCRTVGVTTTRDAEELRPHADLLVTGLGAVTLDMLDTLVTADVKR